MENTKSVILRDKGFIETDLVEISCIWIKRELIKLEKIYRLLLYKSSVVDGIKTNNKVIVGGSIDFSVWKTFEIILPKTLYFGQINFLIGTAIGKIVYSDDEEELKRFEEYLLNH